jgi:cytochrome c oxidase subunit III
MPAVLAEPEPLTIDVRPGGPNGGGPRGFDPDGGGGGGGDDDNEAERAGPQGVPGAGLLAIQIALVSISALFVTIAVVYFVRAQTPISWKPVGVPGFLWLSTALIVASSWTLETARRAFARIHAGEYARWLLITFFLGVGFLISQLLSLRQLLAQGIYLRHNPHSSLFYVVTGAHALHLLGGMIALFYLVVRASLGTGNVRMELGRQRTLMSVSVVYWHFLDALWLALFTLLLLWH